MQKCLFALALIASFAMANTATERYIIQYDDAAWNSLHVSSLPDDTVYVFNELKMTVADLSADEVTMYSSIPGITLTQDQEVEMYGGVQENPNNWGIDRIDQRSLPLDKKFHFGNEGEGVNVYVVDTGVQPNHVEFEGRASLARNFAKDGKDFDCQGHGTHVASSIAGKTVGVAKKAKILGVKVLDCQGKGMLTNVIAGIVYVITEHAKNPNSKTIINMSLGGPSNKPINLAVDFAAKAGVVVVVAAGNSKKDACTFSPAGAPGAITVAASDISDVAANFTNFGKCVDVYAPGVTINGAWIPGNNDYLVARGTSMASPHVAGVAALILASRKAKTPEEVRAVLQASATKDVIKDNRAPTPNRLVYADPSWT